MKTINNVWRLGILVLVGIALILLAYLGASPRVSENVPLPEFIIGTWEIQERQPPSDYFIRELEFIEPDALLVDVNFSEGAYYNIPFDYRFISENRLKITGRLSDEWEIEQKGELLLIRSTWWPSSSSVFIFKRNAIIHWPLVALTLGFLAIGTLFITLPQRRQSDILQHILDFKNSKFSDMYRNILGYFMRFVVFGLGILVGLVAWSWPPLLRIRIPWDSVVTLELSTIMLILGIKIIRASYLASEISMPLARGSWHFLGVLITGCSFYGLGIGLLKLSLFILSGSYLD